jgi:hypothetical protein
MKVFVSYAYDSPEHERDVRLLAELLRANGVDVWLDKWVSHRLNWGQVTLAEMEAADYVLAIASPGYRQAAEDLSRPAERRGAQAEIGLLREFLQEDRTTWTRKILPVLLPDHGVQEVPRFLHPYNETHYRIASFTVDGVRELLELLVGQPTLRPPEVGKPPHMPVLSGGVASGDAPQLNGWTRFAVVDHEQLFGIDVELDQLGVLLGNRDGDWIISIFGPPGAGKTTLAYAAVKRHAARAGYRRIAWVSAKSAHLTPLGEVERSRRAAMDWRDVLCDVAARLELDISDNPMTVERELPRALAALADDEPCLIVVDNLETVQDADAAIHYLEQTSVTRPHKVILTTRQSAMSRQSHRVRERRWDGLRPDAARQYAQYLWQDGHGQRLSPADVDEVAAASEGIPLLVKLVIRLAMFEAQPVGAVVTHIRDSRGDIGAGIADYLYAHSLDALAARVGFDAATRIMNVFCSRVGGESFSADEFYRLSRLSDRQVFDRAKAAACQLALVRSLAGNTRFTVHSLLRQFVCG